MLLNRDRAIGVMKDFGVDFLVGTTPVNHYYLSDFAPWLHWMYRLNTRDKFQFQHYALFARDQSIPPAVIAHSRASNLAHYAEFGYRIEDVYLHGPAWDAGPQPQPEHPQEMHRLYRVATLGHEKRAKTAGEALAKAFRDRGVTKGVVGIDKEGIDPAQLEIVQQELPGLQFKEAGEFFRYIRMVKTPDEIQLLRDAAVANWEGFKALLNAAKPGNTEIDLSRAYRAGAALAGGWAVFCNNASGPTAMNHWEPRADVVLKVGDAIYCDAGCTVRYYNADTNVSAVIGAEPTKRHREVFDAMAAGEEAAAATIKPGVKMSQVLAAFRTAVDSRGVMKSGAFGHAIGIEARDMPMIQQPFEVAKDDIIDVVCDFTLEPGMVFNMEDSKREVGLGSVAVEDSFLVTATGCESLIPQKREIIVLSA